MSNHSEAKGEVCQRFRRDDVCFPPFFVGFFLATFFPGFVFRVESARFFLPGSPALFCTAA
jgi:hypothetical protein